MVVPRLDFYPRSDHSLFLLVEILHPLRRVLRAVSQIRVVRAEAAGLLRILDGNKWNIVNPKAKRIGIIPKIADTAHFQAVNETSKDSSVKLLGL